MKRILWLILQLVFLHMMGIVIARDDAALEKTRDGLGDDLGKPVFLRVVKEDLKLELWVKRDQTWSIKKTYPILAMSGSLGPKTAEGDRQAPEGFYSVEKNALNPRSSYHLSFNIGYPNAYDKSLGRTGSFIMVHGRAVSIGCFAMGDDPIEEIYTMVAQALKAGQPSVPVEIYPFEMTEERMKQEAKSEHYKFWQYLLPGWQYTQKNKAPYQRRNEKK